MRPVESASVRHRHDHAALGIYISTKKTTRKGYANILKAGLAPGGHNRASSGSDYSISVDVGDMHWK